MTFALRWKRMKPLALLICMALLAQILPLDALADSWRIHQPQATGFIYGYTGNKIQPAGSLGSIQVLKSGKYVSEPLQKYQLLSKDKNPANSEDLKEAFWAYCSDFAVKPNSFWNPEITDFFTAESKSTDLLYRRIPLESVIASDNFFKNSSMNLTEITGKLRSILFHSDLMMSLSEMRTASGVSNLTEDEALAATQIAIWNLVNGTEPRTGASGLAMSNTNVESYYRFLQGLQEMPADAVASIQLSEVTKEIVPNSNGKYKVSIGYSLELDLHTAESQADYDSKISALSKSLLAKAEYTENGSKKSINGAIDTSINKIVFTDIPKGASLDVTIEGMLEGIKNVYLFETAQKEFSQTLVSAVRDDLPLKTTLKVSALGNLAKVTIVKDWMNNGFLLPAHAAADYESEFSVTYYGNPKTDEDSEINGLKAIDNFKIVGNNAWITDDVFEIGKSYMVKEVAADAATIQLPSEQYFKVVADESANGAAKVVWTDKDGQELTGNMLYTAGRFANNVAIPTGSVEVKKEVKDFGNLHSGTKSDEFTFVISYKAPDGETGLYGGESYEHYSATSNDPSSKSTDENGQFTLKHDETALFKNIPVGWELTVAENEKDNYVAKPPQNTSVTVKNGEKAEIKYQNTFLVGSLSITKNLTSASWSDFPNGITFVVANEDANYLEEVTLTAGDTTKTLNYVPLGVCTISERVDSVTLAGYALTVTNAGGMAISLSDDLSSYMQTANISKESPSSVVFNNTYRKLAGSLEVVKSLVYEGLAVETQNLIKSKAYNFTLSREGDASFSEDFTLSASEGWSKSFSNLEPGKYIVKELATKDGASVKVGGINLFVDICGEVITEVDGGWSAEIIVTDKTTTTCNVKNIYSKQSGFLTVKKEFAGLKVEDLPQGMSSWSVDKKFEYTIKDQGGTIVDTVYLPTSNGSWASDSKALEPGSYTVAEVSPNKVTVDCYDFGGITYSPVNQQVEVSDYNTSKVKAVMTITNSYARQKGNVQFTKKMATGSFTSASDSFNFTVTVDGMNYSGSYSINGGNAQNALNGKITGVKPNDVVTIGGLNSGATVVITEDADWRYTTTITGTGESNNEQKKISVIIPENSQTLSLTFTNERKMVDKLTIEKMLDGLGWGSFPQGINFTITGPEGWYQSATTEIYKNRTNDSLGSKINASDINLVETATANTYSFKLTDSIKNITFLGIPFGEYTITEDTSSADIASYTRKTSYSVDYYNSGNAKSFSNGNTCAYDQSKQGFGVSDWITFKNEYTLKVGTLEVTKKGDEMYTDSDENFAFSLTFSHAIPESATVKEKSSGGNWGNYSNPTWSNDRKKLDFTLVTGHSLKIEGIPDGTECTLQETGVALDFYNVTYKIGSTSSTADGQGTVTYNGTLSISVENTRKLTGELNVKKEVINSSSFDPDDTFYFAIELQNGSRKVDWTGSYAVTTSSGGTRTGECNNGEFWLKAGETASFTNLPLGMNYTITEIPNTSYTTDPASFTGIVDSSPPQPVSTFTNTLKTGKIEVTKEITGDAKDTFTGKLFTFELKRNDITVSNVAYNVDVNSGITESNGTFMLKAGEKAVFENLPAGEYTVTEVSYTDATLASQIADPSILWTCENSSQSSTLVDGSLSFPFVNIFDKKTGKLEVTKDVNVSSEPVWENLDISEEEYTFTLSDYKGKVITSKSYTLISNTGLNEQKSTEDQTGNFSLKAGETAQFADLEYGKYYVVEANPNPNPAPEENYSISTSYTVGDDYSTTVASDAYVELSDVQTSIPHITVTNTYTRKTGELKVSKSAVGLPSGLTNKEFTFTLYADENKTNAVVGYAYDVFDGNSTRLGSGTTNAVGQFTLQSGQTAVFSSLPTGTYRVVESAYEVEGYSWTGTDQKDAEVVTQPMAEISFTNTYSRIYGNLAITKAVNPANSGDSVPAEWTFDFNIIGPTDWDGSSLECVSDGVYGFALSNSDYSIELNNIPSGTYTITEMSKEDADSYHGYTTMVTIDTGNETVSDEAVITVNEALKDHNVNFNNIYGVITGSLQLGKNYGGDLAAATAPTKEFTFHIVGPLDSEIASTQYFSKIAVGSPTTLKGLPIGKYKICEEGSVDIPKYTHTGTIFSEVISTDNQKDLDIVSGSGGTDTVWYEFEISKDKTLNVICTNAYKKDGGEIKVTKKAQGYVKAGEEFDFIIKNGSTPLGESNYTILDENYEVVEYTQTRADGCFSLQAGQTAYFTGLDTLTTYTVTEYLDPNYSLSITGNSSNSSDLITPVDNSISAEMPAKTGDNPLIEFEFTNVRKTGSLHVEKEVNGPLYDQNPFTVYVTFTEKQVGEKPGEIVDPNALEEAGMSIVGCDFELNATQIVLHLASGETAAIEGIPICLEYEVKENPGAYYYGISYTGNKGEIIDNENGVLCTITNSRSYGQLQITKRGIGQMNPDELFVVQVTFRSGEHGWFEQEINEVYSDLFVVDVQHSNQWNEDTYIITFEIAKDQEVLITGIPVGTTYKVEEILSSEQDNIYVSWVDGAIAQIEPLIPGSHSKDQPENKAATILNFNLPSDSISLMKLVQATSGSQLWTKQFDFLLTILAPAESVQYEDLVAKQKYNEAFDLMQKIYQEVERLEALLKEEGLSAVSEYEVALDKLRLIVDENGEITEDAKAAILAECECLSSDCGCPSNPVAGGAAEEPDGSGNQDDICLCTENMAQTINEAQSGFDANLAVIYHKMHKCYIVLAEILDLLDNGKYVEFTYDEVSYEVSYTIYNSETSQQSLPFNLNDDQIQIIDAQGLPVDLAEIYFAATGTNTYTFSLRHGQTLIISGLPEGTRYEFVEQDSDEALYAGVDITSSDAKDSVDADNMSVNGMISISESNETPGSLITYTNNFFAEYASLSVRKVWSPSGLQGSASVVVELIKDGMPTGDTRELNAANSWQSSFTGLEVGHTYGVLERTTLPDYSVTYSDSVTVVYENRDEASITVTNTLQQRGSLTVNKVWSGSVARTYVEVELYTNGEPTGRILTLNVNNEWRGTFEDLEMGNTYSVVEKTSISNYTVSYSAQNVTLSDTNLDAAITVTNTRQTTTNPDNPGPGPEPDPDPKPGDGGGDDGGDDGDNPPPPPPTVTDPEPTTPPTNPPGTTTPPTTPPGTTTPPTAPPTTTEPPATTEPPTLDLDDTGVPLGLMLHEPGNTVEQQEDGSWIEFNEDGVPLGTWRQDDDGVWIFDEFPPLGAMEPPLPNTGGLPLFAIIPGFGMALLAAGVFLNRRQREEEEVANED